MSGNMFNAMASFFDGKPGNVFHNPQPQMQQQQMQNPSMLDSIMGHIHAVGQPNMQDQQQMQQPMQPPMQAAPPPMVPNQIPEQMQAPAIPQPPHGGLFHKILSAMSGGMG